MHGVVNHKVMMEGIAHNVDKDQRTLECTVVDSVAACFASGENKL